MAEMATGTEWDDARSRLTAELKRKRFPKGDHTTTSLDRIGSTGWYYDGGVQLSMIGGKYVLTITVANATQADKVVDVVNAAESPIVESVTAAQVKRGDQLLKQHNVTVTLTARPAV
jgi:hypothetical protein